MDAGILPSCEWPAGSKDEYGCIPFRMFATALDTCAIDPLDGGLCFTMSEVIKDKHGHVLDGDYDPAGKNGCDHQDTPEWKAEHAQHKKKHHKNEAPMENTITVTALPAAGETTTTASPLTTATVGVDEAISQVKLLAPQGASPALMIGGAAVLAVVGGAIKFGPQMLKARAEKQAQDHEAKMKELELKQEQQQKQDDQHGQCNVARAALEAKVVSFESKLSALESKASEKSEFGFDGLSPDDLEKRLKKLEATLAPKKKPAKK